MHQMSLDMNIPTVDQTISILEKHNQRFGIPLDLDRMCEYWSYYTLKSEDCLRRVIRYIDPSGRNYGKTTQFKDNDFRGWLKANNVVKGFKKTDGDEMSLAKESLDAVIATGLYSEEINKILELYGEGKAAAKAVSLLGNIIQSYPVAGIETWDNHRMVVVRPTWTGQNTGRIGSSDPAVMNITRTLGDIFTVPKGWVYFEADSGQIDPRIIQSWVLGDAQLKRCTMLYDDAYFGYVHYCTYLTDEERRSRTLDLKPVELTDEQKAKRKKFKTFGNAVVYGSKENDACDPDKDLFIRYIGGHPGVVKNKQNIENQIDRGERIFYTAFGSPVDITKGPSDKRYREKASEEAYFNHLVRTAINCRIQGTAADLMRYSVRQADTLLRRKAPNSLILQYVHDAGKFMIAESDYDNVINELREITAYQIDDWLPIHCDPCEGIHDSELKRFV